MPGEAPLDRIPMPLFSAGTWMCMSMSDLILALKKICSSCPLPITWPHLLGGLQTSRFGGWQGESCSFTLISDVLSPSLFKKEGDFPWQTQTSQEASAHRLTHEVDLKPVHIWAGKLDETEPCWFTPAEKRTRGRDLRGFRSCPNCEMLQSLVHRPAKQRTDWHYVHQD